MRDKLLSVRSHATGDSQGPRPVLSRFAAARTAVACREFVGGVVVAASYRSCRNFARPALDSEWSRGYSLSETPILICQGVLQHRRLLFD